ncbi:MAG: Lrp/AsnC ligand binding domain-containing protein [Candidatus Jordarchaeales archaeon]|nr:Lrp/AsnC ligand binding domain-containing protein [Candidatus Jordarchaeia archaeon]
MGLSAYVLIKVASGHEKPVLSRLRELKNVECADLVYGIYDIILKVNVKNVEELDDFVFGVVRQMDGVMETMTCICSGGEEG